MKNIDIKVIGMSCGHCKKSVEDALKELDGVISAVVSLEEKKVGVEYDDSKVSTDIMLDVINELEFKASL